MGIGPGTVVWGARIGTPPVADEWQRFVLGPFIAAGRSGTAYRLAENTNPPLVAKIYDGDVLNAVRTNNAHRQRIVALAQHREMLMQALPFAYWPRRILFTARDPSEQDIPHTILGFTMAALPATTSLTALLTDDAARLRITHQDNIHIAATLADQIGRLHRHPWRFVFGDLSPNNVHVTHDYAHVCFIDTDAFQFQYNHPRYAFRVPGLTPSYTSPGSRETLQAGGTLTTQHDDFVVAILIFQTLMAQTGLTRVHPFSFSDSDEDDNISHRRFPYADPARYPVSREPLTFYQRLPADIQGAFVQTFTSPTPLPSSEWPALLAGYRRGLRRAP